MRGFIDGLEDLTSYFVYYKARRPDISVNVKVCLPRPSFDQVSLLVIVLLNMQIYICVGKTIL